MLTGQMAMHILAMNCLAPAMVVAARGVFGRPRRSLAHLIVIASAAQLVFLWGWHLPNAVAFARDYAVVGTTMHASLFLAALLFWRSVVDAADDNAWQALGALLITGKLFCLLGVLITFAPRLLYSDLTGLHADALAGQELALSDQHLAGLIMVVACPLTYVLAGIVIAARWMSQIEEGTGWSQSRT
jgi:putative membrane protein